MLGFLNFLFLFLAVTVLAARARARGAARRARRQQGRRGRLTLPSTSCFPLTAERKREIIEDELSVDMVCEDPLCTSIRLFCFS